MRRPLLVLLALLATAVPALAAEHGEGEKKKPELQSVDLSPVGLPIVWKGRLVNYVFTTVRVDLSPKVDAAKERLREPYYRDALVRAGHRAPFTDPRDLTQINEPALKAAMMREAGAIAGLGAVTGVVVVAQQPKTRYGLPRLDGAPPPAPRRPIP